MITQAELKEFLHYNQEMGVFTWVKSKGAVKANSIAGTVMKKGYIRIKVSGGIYLAHRLAWLYVYGEMPKDQLDHINNDKADNRITNLREANNYQNQYNKPKQPSNKSGYKGVSFHKDTGKWQAQIRVQGVNKYIGLFDTALEASLAYVNKACKLHKEFAHG
jgi:hypothetical protein